MATIFSRIIRGEIPSHRIYEDEHACAFLDINPARPGHTLVVSREEAPTVFDLAAAAYDGLWRAARLVAGRLQQVTGCERVVVVVYGADVDWPLIRAWNTSQGEFFTAAEVRAGTFPDADHSYGMKPEEEQKLLAALAQRGARR